MIIKKEIQINAIDGFSLSSIVLKPESNIKIKGVIQFHSAIAVKKEFYLKFCTFLAENGFIVVLHDNRGIGASRPESLKGFDAHLREWGELDMPGILNWIEGEYSQYPKYIITHSMGGQLIGLMENHHLADGIFAIALEIGYWNLFALKEKFLLLFLWYIFEPLSSKILGYAPGKKIGIGEDLPKGVAKEWGDWCKRKSYFSAFFGKTIKKNYYSEINVPFKIYSAEDDEYSNEKAITEILKYYSNAKIDKEIVRLDELNTKKIGHFGYFSSKYKESIWTKPIEWIHQVQEKDKKKEA